MQCGIAYTTRRARIFVSLFALALIAACAGRPVTPGASLPGQAHYWNPEEAVRYYQPGEKGLENESTESVAENPPLPDPFRFPEYGNLPEPTGILIPAVASTHQRPESMAAVLAHIPREPQVLKVSPGDRVRVSVSDGDEFSGIFEVDFDGRLKVPFMQALEVAGKSLEQIERAVASALVVEDMFRADTAQVSIEIQQWAPVQISVSGAVFNPGRVLINNRDPEARAQLTQDGGDFAPERYLSAALRAAGGVRPDAAVNSVILIRDGKSRVLDLSGAVTGDWFEDMVLISGDQIVVPRTGRFRNALVRPSAITPPGIRVFISNLTVPAQNNTGSAVGHDSTRLPYGMRFLQGLAAANCIGGSRPTNAGRSAALITTNPVTQETRVIERSIEDLLRHRHRDAFNPYLMPNDALACYDSGITNLRDIARSLSDVLSPFSALLGIM
jgi:protein involved in polysaccharide export with SLBB domain